MNKLIAKLYDQATILEGNGDYFAGELDPVKFAELIVRECCQKLEDDGMVEVAIEMKQHFGVDGMSTEDKKTLIKELLGVE